MELYQIIYFYIFSLVSLLEVAPCESYTRSYSGWYASWYIWVILFGLASCCCGAAGSYYRRRMIMRANNGQRPAPPGVGPIVYPDGTLADAQPYTGAPSLCTPAQPGVYAPQSPPAYNSTNTVAAYQPGGDTNTLKKEYAPPPSYSEVCETPNKYENKPASS